MSAAPETKLFLFGLPRLEVDGAPRQLARRKALALLAYLALYPAEHARETLAALFWGESDTKAARLSLRVTLGELRKALGEKALRGDRQRLQLAPAFPLWVDVREFQERAALARPPEDWQAALDLYRGDFLADVYEDWALQWRSHFHELYLETLLRLVAERRARGENRQAIDLARRALLSEPANERLHRQIMLAYEALGERAAALKQYALCAESLHHVLGEEPEAETRALFQRLQNAPAQTTNLAARPTNLPSPATSFIGREAELAAVERLLVPLKRGQTPARLVTLTGAGGSGKTRLSIQAAAELVDTYPEGVWWVELAALTRPEEVAHQIARVCGVNEVPAEPIETSLLAGLHGRQMLLVLDNCEHLVAVCEKIARRILAACPRVQILATSREGLGLPGEQLYPVPTLPLPVSDETDPEAAFRFEGVRLFVERARLIQPRFRLEAANLRTVVSVCRRLDGIPLALELAAAQLKLLTLEQLAVRLDDRFRLLEATDGSLLPRQKTLRALIDWSYDLLPEAERALLRQLSAFRGGWTLAAAETVCGEAQDEVLDLLARLVDTSLILAQPEQGRFAILETIREYAAEKLLQAGEAARVRERHFAYYLTYAETQEPRQWGREQVASLDAVDREHDNLRAAAGWALEHGAQELQLHLGAALGRFWQQHHHVQEGADYLLAVLAAPTEAHVLLRARCTFWAGEFLWRCGQEAEGLAHLAHARSLYQSIQQLGGIAEVLQRLTTIAIYQGDLATAEALCAETIAIARQVGHTYALSASLNGLGEIARLRGDFASAQPYYEETLRLSEESGNLRLVGIALLNLGLIARPLGNYAAGRAYLLRANTIFGELGEKPNQPYVLEGLADLEAAEGRPERAVSLYAAVENLCATTRISLYGDDQRQHEQAVQTLRQQLTPKRFAAAWQAGLRLTLAQAIQLAPKPDS